MAVSSEGTGFLRPSLVPSLRAANKQYEPDPLCSTNATQLIQGPRAGRTDASMRQPATCTAATSQPRCATLPAQPVSLGISEMSPLAFCLASGSCSTRVRRAGAVCTRAGRIPPSPPTGVAVVSLRGRDSFSGARGTKASMICSFRSPHSMCTSEYVLRGLCRLPTLVHGCLL